MRLAVASLLVAAATLPALAQTKTYDIPQPKGTWQVPGEIQQPKGRWQVPGEIQKAMRIDFSTSPYQCLAQMPSVARGPDGQESIAS